MSVCSGHPSQAARTCAHPLPFMVSGDPESGIDQKKGRVVQANCHKMFCAIFES